jgi:hypothetical protein
VQVVSAGWSWTYASSSRSIGGPRAGVGGRRLLRFADVRRNLPDRPDSTMNSTGRTLLPHQVCSIGKSSSRPLPPRRCLRPTRGEHTANPRRTLVVPVANPGRSSGNPFEYTPPDDHPLNHGDLESTAAIPPTETAIPRQPLPQDFPQRHRLQAAELLAAIKTFTGVVTTVALLKTFAALFDELGGSVGGSVASRAVTRLGLACGWSWRRTTGPRVTPVRSP